MNINDAITAIIDNDDALDFALRNLLISNDIEYAADTATLYDDRYERAHAIDMLTLIHTLLAHADNETLTQLALANSLCPLHFIDYAICFDDDDAECRPIRSIHPSHDT